MRKLSLLCLALLATVTACGGAPSSLFNQAGYYVRGDTVYYLNAFPGEAFEVEGADVDTFEKLDEQSYAKDKSVVYLDGVTLLEADPATFQLLGEPNFAKDAGHIFMRAFVLSEDPDHFEFVGGGVTKDSDHVYWSDGDVLSDDPEHFEIVSDADYYLFTRDSTTVHVNGLPINGADPATFKVLGVAYAQDDRAGYYFTDRILDFDSASFEVLDGSFGRDDGHAYWMGKAIPGADPATFVVLNGDFECTADATHAYYRDKRIKGVDPTTISKGSTVTNCDETFLSVSP